MRREPGTEACPARTDERAETEDDVHPVRARHLLLTIRAMSIRLSLARRSEAAWRRSPIRAASWRRSPARPRSRSRCRPPGDYTLCETEAPAGSQRARPICRVVEARTDVVHAVTLSHAPVPSTTPPGVLP